MGERLTTVLGSIFSLFQVMNEYGYTVQTITRCSKRVNTQIDKK